MRSSSGNEFAALVALKNSTMSGYPTADLSVATTPWNGLELVRLKRSTSIFAIVILSSKTALVTQLRFQEGSDVADEQRVILKQRAVSGIGIENELSVAQRLEHCVGVVSRQHGVLLPADD